MSKPCSSCTNARSSSSAFSADVSTKINKITKYLGYITCTYLINALVYLKMNVLNIREAVILIRWQLVVGLPSQNFTCFS